MNERHTRTDPLCIHHRAPRTWLGRLLFDRRRGRICRACICDATTHAKD